MLKGQYELSQFDHYKSVYIYDGPYQYVLNRPLVGKNFIRLDETEFGKELLLDSKFIYKYKIWENEEEKRVTAYDAIDSEIIVLHDTDEFYEFDTQNLISFIKSDKSVGSFYCQNLFLDGVNFTSSFYLVDDYKKLPSKNFIFKKNEVSAVEHLNYLWLVGVAQEPPKKEKIYFPSLALGNHLTQMRSDDGQQQKYIFYSSLTFKESGNSVLDNLELDVKEGLVSYHDALRIFIRSIPDFCRAPGSKGLIPKKRIDLGEKLENVVNKMKVQISDHVHEESKVKTGLNYHLFFSAKNLPLTIFFSEVVKVKARFLQYNYLEASSESYINELGVEKLFIDQVNGAFGLLIAINLEPINSTNNYLTVRVGKE
jgi:hypothetical protein